MKNYFLPLISSGIFLSCHSNSNQNTPATDTVNRSKYDKSQVVEMKGVSDTIIGSNGAAML